MNATPESTPTAKQLLAQAYAAFKQGDRIHARQLAGEAARLSPDMEDAWLLMAALASPAASVDYIKKALQINPGSPRAQKAMLWALERFQAAQPAEPPVVVAQIAATVPPPAPIFTAPIPVTPWVAAPPPPASADALVDALRQPVAQPNPKPQPRRLSWVTILAVLFLAVLAFGVWAFFPTIQTVLAGSPAAQLPISLFSKPTLTNTPTATFTSTATATFTPTKTATATATFTATATQEPTKTFTPRPTNTAKPPAATQPPGSPSGGSVPPVKAGERWIDIDLSQQKAYAYEGTRLVKSFIVSTGTARYPTVIGQFHIYVKYRTADMSGPGYYLSGVPYVMYFYSGYGLHGTYWHNNFGTPMSHGCVNFRPTDAAWVFDFTVVGTLVNIHP